MIANGYDRSFEQILVTDTQPTVDIPDWRTIEVKTATRERRIPAHEALDLGGVAKGWAAKYIAAQLASFGACLINVGGDMVACGAPDIYLGWPIDIEDPFTGDVFNTIYLKDRSIVTSGTDYRFWQTTTDEIYHLLGKSAKCTKSHKSFVDLWLKNMIFAHLVCQWRLSI